MHGLLGPKLQNEPESTSLKFCWPNKSQVQLNSRARETDTISEWEELHSYISKGHGFTEGHNHSFLQKYLMYLCLGERITIPLLLLPFLCFPFPFLVNASLNLYGFLLLLSATISSEMIWSIRFYTAISLSV